LELLERLEHSLLLLPVAYFITRVCRL
jgi:hypothetical protein